MMKVMSVFGTRPEAIKMAPVVAALENNPNLQSLVCITGQHREMLFPVLEFFRITPDYNLDIMKPNQTLNGIASAIIAQIDPILEREKPDWILVHGDTTSSMAAALAAFHRKIKIGHVEAGLRTNDLSQPWPEEMNRRVTDAISDMLFAPTLGSRSNLLTENLGSRKTVITGNTVIDALSIAVKKIAHDQVLRHKISSSLPNFSDDRKLLLVTGHRRENFGSGFLEICQALSDLSTRDDLEIVYPVHLNPNVREPVNSILSNCKNVHLIEPLDYLPFVWLMQRAHIVLTDSGGVQEEAPGLGKPVLVMRDVTERPEAVRAGTVKLVGTSAEKIKQNVVDLLTNEGLYYKFSRAQNPYGDGQAACRIVSALVGEDFVEFK